MVPLSDRPRGFVTIAGAGPGHPELITSLAVRRLKEADVVLFDRLIDPEILWLASSDAQLEDVGKHPGSGAEQQQRIVERLIELASAGKRVVRLKGGDPLVFGRGAEEALALTEAGIPFEIVPGVSSVLAAPAYAGVPLTHRELSRAFAVVTGKAATGEVPSEDEVDWEALAKFKGTLVFLMAVETLEAVCSRLIAAGLDPATPAVIVQDATMASQRVVSSNAESIAREAQQAGIESPAVLVIGEVVSLRERIEWAASRPLAGKTVLVTRPVERSSALAASLRDLGASVVLAPSIRTEILDQSEQLIDAVERSLGGGFSWLVFASRTGVDAFFTVLQRHGGDTRSLAGTKIACVGEGTASALEEHGIRPDFLPRRFTAADLASDLPLAYKAEQVLVVQARGGRPELSQILKERGFDVEVVEAYQTLEADKSDARLARVRDLLGKKRISAVVFGSTSQVDNFVELFGVGNVPPIVVCIGPTTADAASRAGLKPAAVASQQSVEGLVRALVEAVDKGQQG